MHARRTKIVATVGPASWDLGVLEQMIAAGTDVFRLNFSHAGPDKQAQTIETIRLFGEHVIPKVDPDPVHRTTKMRQAAIAGAAR